MATLAECWTIVAIMLGPDGHVHHYSPSTIFDAAACERMKQDIRAREAIENRWAIVECECQTESPAPK